MGAGNSNDVVACDILGYMIALRGCRLFLPLWLFVPVCRSDLGLFALSQRLTQRSFSSFFAERIACGPRSRCRFTGVSVVLSPSRSLTAAGAAVAAAACILQLGSHDVFPQ